jgi:hypothetical protein
MSRGHRFRGTPEAALGTRKLPGVAGTRMKLRNMRSLNFNLKKALCENLALRSRAGMFTEQINSQIKVPEFCVPPHPPSPMQGEGSGGGRGRPSVGWDGVGLGGVGWGGMGWGQQRDWKNLNT